MLANSMGEAFTIKTGTTYAVTDIVLGKPHEETFSVSGSSAHGPVYSRHSMSMRDISFRTPVSDIRAGLCGAMTYGDEVWRVLVSDVSPGSDSLEVRGLALTSERMELLDSPPSPRPPSLMPEVWRQFYDV